MCPGGAVAETQMQPGSRRVPSTPNFWYLFSSIDPRGLGKLLGKVFRGFLQVTFRYIPYGRPWMSKTSQIKMRKRLPEREPPDGRKSLAYISRLHSRF